MKYGISHGSIPVRAFIALLQNYLDDEIVMSGGVHLFVSPCGFQFRDAVGALVQNKFGCPPQETQKEISKWKDENK